MRVNADFSKRAVVHGGQAAWVPSPMPGVERLMLDRIGEEVARATTIVRFAPGSEFSAHTHDGGEEFLVLDGVFEDELGAFPEGAYVRNPPTSSHTPSARQGATILVKLHQFDPADRTHVRTDVGKLGAVAPADRLGVAVKPLFQDAREEVRIETWAPGASVTLNAPGGLEAFVVRGGFTETGERFERWSWLRLPPGARLVAEAGAEGAEVWIKTGHLAEV